MVTLIRDLGLTCNVALLSRSFARLCAYYGSPVPPVPLPITSGSTHELHLVPYTSAAQLLERLLFALDHRHDGFQNK